MIPVAHFCMVVALLTPPAADEEQSAADPALAQVLADPEVGPVVRQAMAFRDEGNGDAALEQLRKANAVLKRKHGSAHPEQLPILDLAAEILFEAGRFADAVPPLERSVSIREGLDSASQPEGNQVAIASSLLLLGKAYAQTGRPDRAVDALARAAVIFGTTLGEDHDATAATRRELEAAATTKEAG